MKADKKIEEMLAYLNINAKAFSEKLGYERPQIIYDILKGRTKRISEDLAIKITTVFPLIRKSWLLADEGEMIYASINQEINGDHNTQVAGNNNHVNSPATLDKAIDEIAAQRKLVEKSQEQIDRLLSIIENMNKNKNYHES